MTTDVYGPAEKRVAFSTAAREWELPRQPQRACGRLDASSRDARQARGTQTAPSINRSARATPPTTTNRTSPVIADPMTTQATTNNIRQTKR